MANWRLLLDSASAKKGRNAMVSTGSLYGTVTNQTGELLRGVTLMLTGGQGPPKVQVSDAQGSFRFLSLTPGPYSVEAQLEGFQSSTTRLAI